AGDYEIFARPEWVAMRNIYGLNFRTQRQMQPEFMYQAVAKGDVDVISAYTSDGQISTYDLIVLADDKHAIPSYDAILLIAKKRTGDKELTAALTPFTDTIDIPSMRAAKARAKKESKTPKDVARWLGKKIRRQPQ